MIGWSEMETHFPNLLHHPKKFRI